MKKLLFFIPLLLSISLYGQEYTWFSESVVNTTVLLEKKVGDKYVPHGTGFLIYHYPSNKLNSDYSIVVTCNHILKNKEIFVTVPADKMLVEYLKEKKRFQFGVSIWELDGNNIRLKVKLKKDSSFVVHDSLDIGAFPIFLYNRSNDEKDSLIIKYTNTKGCAKSAITKRENVQIGEDVLFSGFPFSIGTDKGFGLTGYYSHHTPTPLIRFGSIAWAPKNSKEFLLDAFSYNGNSGSPIFTKDVLNSKIQLIGMIIGHLGSNQSDNIGLVRCLWIDDIMEVVEKAEKLIQE